VKKNLSTTTKQQKKHNPTQKTNPADNQKKWHRKHPQPRRETSNKAEAVNN